MSPPAFPPKLQKGDKIKVIAPSRALASLKLSKTSLKKIIKHWESLGLRVELAKHVNERSHFSAASIESKLADLHEAFKDDEIKMIIATVGGFSSNQILKGIDYELIKKHPKIICGYSDFTAVANAIYTKTGLVTYYGPFFTTFYIKKCADYTKEFFKKCLFHERSFLVEPSVKWSNDDKKFDWISVRKNLGPWVINSGEAKGKIIGGNLCTLNLLQGTEFMPSIKDTILFIEDDDMAKEFSAVEFDRNLQSLLHLPDADKIRGLVIGRFQPASRITHKILQTIIKNKKELNNLPVIANVDFGHTLPMMTFPIGGEAEIKAGEIATEIEIMRH
ncbi:MAG: S66 peptidase family protein [Candidatus Uhrbacteria bacterium]